MAGMKGMVNSVGSFAYIITEGSFTWLIIVPLPALNLACQDIDYFFTRLVTLAFTGSIGMTLVILACALPDPKVWWPFFVVLFYVLAPLPTILARRYTEHTGSSNSSIELAIFITMGFVVSSFALPMVLARSPDGLPVISWNACYLTLLGNVIVYMTYIGFFVTLYQEDSDYSMW